MRHPMSAQLGLIPRGLGVIPRGLGSAQMGSIFDQLLEAAKKAGQGAIDSAKQRALAEAAMAVVNDPKIQAAVAAEGEKAAYQKLIDQLYATRQDITGFVSENPYKTLMIVGGVVVGAGALIYFLKR